METTSASKTPAPEAKEVPASEMMASVRASLVQQAERDADAITLRRAGRTVILRGLVSSHAARHFAAMALWHLPGVGEVKNELRVNRSWPEPDETATLEKPEEVAV